MRNKSMDRKIGILDWLIFFSIIIMIIMVYVPLNVWAEENKYKKERRGRMKNIALAEEFFYELTGEYTTDINELFLVVEAAMDSLIADSTFIGTQNININNKSYSVNLDASFAERVDTSYSIPEIIKETVLDTLYKIGVKNENDENAVDTLWVKNKELNKIINTVEFISKYYTHYENEKGDKLEIKEYINDKDNYIDKGFKPKKMKIEERKFVKTNYLRKKFHLTDNFIFCPISKNNFDKKKFILSIDNSDPKTPIFSIESPINKSDNEFRYGIFRYRPGNKETIIGGNTSWAGK